MAPHESWDIEEPENVDAYSEDHDNDWLSGSHMKGLKAAFSSNETSSGSFGAHSTSSFINDVKAFTSAFLSSNGDSKKLIDDFVKKMQQLGIKVTVKQ